jgi:hypothetical protein
VEKLGIEKVPPIVTRGVVLDMTAVYGSAIVPEKTEFSVADIQKALHQPSGDPLNRAVKPQRARE